MKNIISCEVVIAYGQCELKSFLLLFTDNKGSPHEYISIIEDETRKNRGSFFSQLKIKNPNIQSYSPDAMKKGVPIMIQATLSSECLTTYVDALVRQEKPLHVKNHNYIPALVVGTFKISKEQKLHLAFTGYVLSKLQKKMPVSGIIFAGGNKAHKIKMEPYIKEVEQIHRKLTSWISKAKPEPPPIILNKHCHYCPFHLECEIKAKEQDHLSLLDGISTSKQIKKYEKRGG